MATTDILEDQLRAVAQPQASDRLTREEEAKLALEHTAISRGHAWLLWLLFLATISIVPLAQHLADIHAARALQAEGRVPNRTLFQPFAATGLLPSFAEVCRVRDLQGAIRLLPAVQEIQAYEDSLEENSLLSRLLLPRMQYLLSHWAHAGNEQAYPGSGNWLYYRPDVDYVTSPGFLDPALMRRQARSGGEAQAIQPDPVKALAQLSRQLADRDITLVVMPAPVKPVLEPEYLSGRSASPVPQQNPSYAAFLRAMASHRIPVVDVSGALAHAKDTTHRPQYLATDTHWTPAAMDLAVRELADAIRQVRSLPPSAQAYVRTPMRISNLGDIAGMLKLPANQRLYRPETVTIQQVSTATGAPWTPQRTADVLLLGDSFTNIYSLHGMQWGERAGLAEQLSYHLQRPVDRIALNAGGAFSSRFALRNELLRGKDRLAGKRVVVYEFAMRDLLAGDWRLLDLPKVRKPASTPVPVPVAEVAPSPAIASPAAPPAPTGTTEPNPSAPVPPAPNAAVDRLPRGSQPAPMTTSAHVSRPSLNATPSPAPQGRLVVRGTVAAIASAPAPGSVPYRDCVIGLYLHDVQAVTGPDTTDEVLVYVWGLRDNVLTPAAAYKTGQTVTLTLTPWDEAEATYGGYNRREVDDEAALLLDAYWGE